MESESAGPTSLLPSFVVRPHAKNFHDPFSLEDLIDEAVVDIDPARVCPGEIAAERFKRGRRSKGVVSEDFEKRFGLEFESPVRLTRFGHPLAAHDRPGKLPSSAYNAIHETALCDWILPASFRMCVAAGLSATGSVRRRDEAFCSSG